MPALATQLAILLGLVVGTITDIKRREVPDWLNFSLIAGGIGLGVLGSALEASWQPLISSLLGLLLGVGIGYAMFYAGQWGGGDAKMIMGLGALLGLSITFPLALEQLPTFILYLANVILAGALYGIAWAIIIGIRKRKELWRSFVAIIHQDHLIKTRIFIIAITLLWILLAVIVNILLLRLVFLILACITFFTFYLWVMSQALEQACMRKRLPTDKLTEGDWVVDDVWIPRKKYFSVLEHLRKQQLAKHDLCLQQDDLLSLYHQLGWRRRAALREESLKKKHLKPDQELLRQALKGYAHHSSSWQELEGALRGGKQKLLATAEKLKKQGCADLLAHLRQRSKYDLASSYVTGPKELGITKEQILMLRQHKVRHVLIKEGIPFVPSFLIAYVITLALGNWFLLFL